MTLTTAQLAALPIPRSVSEAQAATVRARVAEDAFAGIASADSEMKDALHALTVATQEVERLIRARVTARNAMRAEHSNELRERPFRGHLIKTDGTTIHFGAESKSLTHDHARALLRDHPGAVAWYTGRKGEAEPTRIRA